MNTPYTFEQAVHAIGVNTLADARPFPRSFRDNHPVSQLLCIDWRTAAGRDGWLDYFGAKLDGNVAWSSDWHGWRVLMTAHFGDVEDSGPVGIEQRHGSPPADPGTPVTDDDINAAVRRIAGLRCAADLASALLEPDATIEMPAVDPTRADWNDNPPECNVPYVRTVTAGAGSPFTNDVFNIVSACVRPGGHLGDHADFTRQWQNSGQPRRPVSS